MGLDVAAYEKVELVLASDTESELYSEVDDVRYLGEARGFAGRMGMPEGFYRISGNSHNFCAGSYFSYNSWRRELARVVGSTADAIWDGYVPKAFGELINFTDCAGTLGTQVCAKLASDFATYQREAEQFANSLGLERGRFIARCHNWQQAFEVAAKDGVVVFY